MKSKVLVAQAIRFLTLKATVYIPRAVDELVKVFKFVRYPEGAGVLSFDASTALEFVHGRVVVDGREIIIANLRLFAGAVVLTTNSSTDDADAAIEQVLAWASNLIDTKLAILGYVSQIEVQFSTPLERLSSLFSDLGETLGGHLVRYGAPAPSRFQLAWVSMITDPQKTSPPCDFRLERRQGRPFDEGVFFAQAPLRTDDHIEVLEMIDARLHAGSR